MEGSDMVFPSLVDKRFCKTPVTVTFYQEGNDEDGEPQEAVVFEGLCNYQDSAKTVLTADKRLIQLSAQAYFIGDIAPALPVISGGEVAVSGKVRRIAQGMKARNPDGTVNYTRLDLK